MKTRQEAELEGKKGKGMFCKISLNGSYGYDAMNTQKYMKSKICNEEKTIKSQRKQNFVNTIPLGEDVYQVIYKPKTYKCKTPLQVALFTLDNAKYWYLVFIYDFLFKCVDTNRLHFIEGDTDSMYWAIAGDNKLDNTQAFQSIIVNKEFYDENIFKFAPFDFFCYNEGVRPKFSTKSEEKAHEKKLLGLAIEKQGDNMIALCPKCYTSFNDDKKTIALKMKGVNAKQNKHINSESYKDIVENGGKVSGQNSILQLKSQLMSRIQMDKTALTGAHTKAVVHPNGCCMPFISGAKYLSL